MAKKQTSKPVAANANAGRVAAPSATATHRKLIAVVSHATKDSAEAILTSFDATHGTQFAGGFTAIYVPPWDGISEPAPDPAFWMQEPARKPLEEAELFQEALDAAAGHGVRWFEALVPPDEIDDPSNTVDSIYASGFNPDLPVAEGFAGVCAWYLDVVGSLPPREQLP